MEIVIAIASKVAAYAVAPITRQIGYVINYKSNVENFNEQVNRLKGAREIVQRSVDEAKRNGEEIYEQVDNWLNRVTQNTEEAEEFIAEDEDKAKKRCLNGWCPNLKSRYQLSKKAKKKMEVVVKLQVEGDFPSVSYRVRLQGIWSTSIEGSKALESRMAVLEKIMETLRSSNLSVIGVYGMGGVGKTTLVEQVARKAEKEKLFDEVVMATVKEPPNVKEIQARIADKLGLKFDVESESGKADRLWDRLKKEKKILVIIDNVLTALDLKEIGIPFGDDHQGCKILLTSKYQYVLSHEMGTEKDFRVEFLPEDEAWNLFETMVGDIVKDAKVRPVAIEVAKRCGGLPVMIVTVARALKDKSLYEWKDAKTKLSEINSFDNEEEWIAKVYKALELSYNHLKGEEVKSLFLLCSQLFPNFFNYQDLLRYSVGLGIFKKINNLEEARNRVQTLVNHLKACCFLLEDELPWNIKMHDLVAKFGISIASRDHRLFFVEYNSELKEWPSKDMLEQYMAITLNRPKILELPEELQCLQAKSFILNSRDPSLKIPENFFKGMKKLKVLDLTKVHLSSLSLSLHFLENLQTLCLSYCILGDIAALGELKKLEILSLRGSNIVRLPSEIGKLTRLLLLDLSNCSKLTVIPPGVLSSLSQLQDLDIGNSFTQWEIEEWNTERSNASLAELMNLSNLISLVIHIPDAKILPKEFFSRRLERYNILIGDKLDWSGMYPMSRILKLKLHIYLPMEYGVKMLLKETEDLYLYELKGVENVLFELDGDGFPLLKHLQVQNSPEILYIINSKGRVSCSAFLFLKSLILDTLINLERICHGQLIVGSFAKLKTIKVKSCHKLKYLFSISLASGLRQLQEIEVTKCKIIEEIVADGREDDANYNASTNKIEFTQLRSLTLQDLPQLTGFCSIAKMPSVSQRGQKLLTGDSRSTEIVSEDELTTPTPLFNEKVVFPNLEELKLFSISVEKIWHDQLLAMSFHIQNLTCLIVDGCGNLKYLLSTSMVESLVTLKILEICRCKFMEQVIVTEEEGMIKMSFPKLESLKLIDIPNLTRFCSESSIEFPVLRNLWFENCPNLKTFTSREQEPKIAGEGDEQRIGKGKLGNTIAPFFNEKAMFPNLMGLKLCSVDNEKLWHDQLPAISYFIQNLTFLRVEGCGSLRYLFTSCIVKSLVQLVTLVICECKIMEEIIFTEGSQEEGWMNKMPFPRLEILILEALPKLKRFGTANFIQCLVLKELRIINCPEVKSFISNSISVDMTVSSEPEEMNLDEKFNTDIATLFDEKVVLPSLEGLMISHMNLKKIWHNELAANSFCKLDRLKVNFCGKLLNIFPCKMLKRLQRLDTLNVHDCGLIEEIFELLELDASKTQVLTAIPLRNMYLVNLPNLKHVWNKDPTGILIFQSLRIVNASKCQRLKALFPASVARGLHQLEELKISFCGMEEIVAKVEGVEAPTSFVFPRVTSLELCELPELKSFYPGIHISEWPLLKRLVVFRCDKVEIFASRSLSFQETSGESQHKIPMQQPLFLVDKVAFPSLEELILDQNDIMKEIWHGQFSAEYFCKLKVLTLISFAKEFVIFPSCFLQELPNLEKLVVINAFFKEIFPCESIYDEEILAGTTLARLSELKLSKLPELMHLWKEGFQGGPAFENLGILEVSECDNLKIFVPSSISFQNLTILEVSKCHGLINLVTQSTARSLVQLSRMIITECELMTEVITNEGSEAKDGIAFNRLKYLGLHCLPSLTSFCSGSNTLEFPSMEEVIVRQCPKMKIFSDGASSAPKLQGIQVAEDERHWEGNLNTTIQWLSTEMAGFCFLESLNLSEVPEIQEIWRGQNLVRLRRLRSLVVDKCAFLLNAIPSNLLRFLNKLEVLDVRNCDLLEEVFDLEGLNADEGHLALLSQLRKFSLSDLPQLRHIWNEDGQRILDLKNLKLLKVHNCSSLRNIFAPSLALGLVQLEEMEVKNCPMIEKIISTEVEEEETDKIVFPRLDSIYLESLPNLTSFCSGTSILECPSLIDITIIDCPNMKAFATSFLREQEAKMAGEEDEQRVGNGDPDFTIAPFFNDKAVFPNLEFLKLCSVDVEKIWHDQLPAMSYCIQNLTNLTVKGCGNLRYLFTSCMVKSLLQLEELEIRECKIMEEIIVTEGSQEEGWMDKMLFPKLECLVLEALPKLKRFCSANFIECSVLYSLEIINCPELKSFMHNSISADMTVSIEPEEMNLKGNLNTDIVPLFDEKVLLPRLKVLEFSHMTNLKKIWHDKLAANSFCQLDRLTVYFCENLLNIFPSSILERLQRLVYLDIRNCDSLEELFEHQGPHIRKTRPVVAPQLRELNLDNLPNLKHVWNEDIQEILAFQNLRSITIFNCPSLEQLFPAFVARGLLQLAVFKIDTCRMKKIVAKEKGVEAASSFVFPRVNSMKLWKLPELKCFYPGIHTSEWPMLKKLVVYGCDKVERFASKISSSQETHGESQHDIPVQQSLFLVGKVAFPNLEELRLEWNDIMKEIWHGQFSAEYFSKLKVLKLIHFPEKSAIFPSCFLQSLPNLEKLLVSDASFKEIFLFEGFTGEEKHGATHIPLSELKLSELPELMYLWKETFQPGPVFRNLETLEVSDCGKLKNLVPSSVSFQNLTALIVSKCHGLIHLVTPSTAKCLVQLTKMSIIECDMIEEIVNSGEETQEIAFSRLKYMELHFLPRLTSFCKGNYTFEFPSLEEVIVRQCPKMQIFSVGASEAPKLQGIQVEEEEWHWEGNLNTTIKWLSTEMVGFRFLEYLNLSEVPEIQEIWHGQNSVNFRHLRSLVVDKCAFLLNAIPSSLLPFLNKLEVLDVRNCDLLEEVFDLEGLNADEGHLALLSQLSKFSLSDLPQLRHIWNEDGQRILDLKNLKLLKVHNCSSLKKIFAPSLALGLVQLKEMEVKNCPMIEKIITAGVEEEETDKIVFPRLGSIILESLPNLTSFYSGTSILECPSLKDITIIYCPNMKTFTNTFLKEQEAKMAGEEDEQRIGKGELDITIAPFFNDKVVLPALETLKLSQMKNLKKIWHDKLAANSFCKIDSLVVYFCENLVNIFPSNMLERLRRLDDLIIHNCDSLEELFEHQGPHVRKTRAVAAPQLRELRLYKLPNLKHVWNEDIQEILAFQSLRSIQVIDCRSLEHLFPAFVARRLLQLEELEIWSCSMKEIVAKDKGVEAATSFVFPQVTSIELRNLPELKCFYPGIHTSEWPMLKKLGVIGCDEVEGFALKISSFQETHGESQHDIPVQQSIFLVGKVAFANLEELRLERNDIMKEIWHGQFSVEYFCKLKVLELIRFPMEFGSFPSCFLQELPNLEKLVVRNAFFKEIFPCERIYDEDLQAGTTFARLSELKLSELPELMHLWKEGFQGGPAFENLGTLEVSKCDNLKILVPSSISFQNLTILEVWKCHGLINLVTLSTARSLVQLSKMIISECDLMTEVIANDGSEAKDEIAFNQINYLELHCLPSLTSFCSGSYTFNFPSLEEVIVEQCPKLQISPQGVLTLKHTKASESTTDRRRA